MATERQIAANRLNAKRSTGPKTPDGKAVASYNALSHGLRSRGGLLPGENPEDFSDLSACVFAELAPESAIEKEHAERIATLLWRLRRIPAFEAALLAWANASSRDVPSLFPVAPPRFFADGKPPGGTKDILDFGRSLDAFLVRAGGKLNRYEAALQRQLAASMTELRRMQVQRAQDAADGCPRAE